MRPFQGREKGKIYVETLSIPEARKANRERNAFDAYSIHSSETTPFVLSLGIASHAPKHKKRALRVISQRLDALNYDYEARAEALNLGLSD